MAPYTPDAHDEHQEALQSMLAATQDIQRWILLAAVKGRSSVDRIRDIRNQSIRIADLTARLRVDDR